MEFLVSLAVIIPAVVLIGGIVLYFVRLDVQRWIVKEVVSLLKNDDTPVAVYAHQAREEAKAAKESAEQVRRDVAETHTDVRQIRDLLIQHVTDREIHGGK